MGVGLQGWEVGWVEKGWGAEEEVRGSGAEGVVKGLGVGRGAAGWAGWEVREDWVGVMVEAVVRGLVAGWEARGWVGAMVLGVQVAVKGREEAGMGGGWVAERALVVGRAQEVAAAASGLRTCPMGFELCQRGTGRGGVGGETRCLILA